MRFPTTILLVLLGCSTKDPYPVFDSGSDATAQDASADAQADAVVIADTGSDATADATVDEDAGTGDSGDDAQNDSGADAGTPMCSVSACQATRTEPRCQVGNCDPVLGCVVTNARELETCDDNDARTYDDRCRSGACAGLACTCAGVSSCCDGCTPRNEGGHCNAGDGFQDDGECSTGTCEATACECTSGPCCDGCYFRPSNHVCEPHSDTPGEGPTYAVCSASMQCGGTVRVRAVDVHCAGDTAACDGARLPAMPTWSQYVQCPELEYCLSLVEGETADELCVPVNPAFGCDQM
jgi:hypothetical protein